MKWKVLLGYTGLVVFDLIIVYVFMPSSFTQNLDRMGLFTMYGVFVVVFYGLHLLLDRVKKKREARLSYSTEVSKQKEV